MNEQKFDLTEHELEFLRDIHVAQALRELGQHPGWLFYNEIIDKVLKRVEAQHLAFSRKATRDAYWLSGARLDAVKEFIEITREIMKTKVDLLNHPLIPPSPNGHEED